MTGHPTHPGLWEEGKRFPKLGEGKQLEGWTGVATRGQQSPYSTLFSGFSPQGASVGVSLALSMLSGPSSCSAGLGCGLEARSQALCGCVATWLCLLLPAVKGTPRRHWIPSRNPVGDFGDHLSLPTGRRRCLPISGIVGAELVGECFPQSPGP